MEHPAHLLRQLQHGHARKRFGQHFLASEGVLRKIVAAAGISPGDRVVEIGPGLGGLTECLLEAGAEVVAVELDRDLAAFLRERLGHHDALSIVEADAATVDWLSLLDGGNWSCVANLPYNVGTSLVTAMLDTPERFSQLVVMVQKEVAERMVAHAGDRRRGSLSVYCERRSERRIVIRVPPGAFLPPPKVDSAVVHFQVRHQAATSEVDPAWVDRVVRTGFSSPRKTLRRTLSGQFGRERVVRALAAAEVDGGLRPAVLTVDAWERLAVALRAES